MNDFDLSRHGTLRGFTLIEIIIVMAVSAIIVGMAVSFILILNKTGEESLAGFNKNSAARDLYSILQKEFKKAEEIFESDTHELTFYRMKEPIRIMKFSDNEIIFVNGGDYDTLNIAVSAFSIQKLADHSDLVGSISFEMQLHAATCLVSINKEYSNAALFNRRRANDHY